MRGGYPSFSRGLLVGLSMVQDVKIGLNDNTYSQAILSNDIKAIIDRGIIIKSCERTWDVDLYLGNIHDAARYKKTNNSILISGYPFLGLDENLATELKKFKATFTSGQIDACNFSDHQNFDLPQPASISFVNGNEKIRASDLIKILFVGTFNYWKGIDQAISTYIRSDLELESRLTLKCPIEHHSGESFASEIAYIKHRELFLHLINLYITNELKDLEPTFSSTGQGFDFGFHFSINGKKKSIVCDMRSSNESEMIQIYDDHDVLLHLSRGETWSMPVIEALLRGLHVVFPSHYGCANYVRDLSNAWICESIPRDFSAYDFSDRSSGGGKIYLAGGTKYFEVSLDAASAALNSACLKAANEVNPLIDRLKLYERVGYANIGLIYHDKMQGLNI